MKKFLIALLSGLLMMNSLNFVFAEEADAVSEDDEVILELEDIDPASVEIQRLGEIDEEPVIEAEEEPYKLSDIVRVSIVMDEDAALDAGYSVENYAQNQAIQDYRSQLKAKQDAVTERINSILSSPIEVKWNLTLAVNLISANVTYGDISKIKTVEGVKNVEIEQHYEATEDEINTASTSSLMVGAQQSWANGYTGAGSRVAIIDTGIDTAHQSFNSSAFDYAINEVRSEGKTVNLFTSSDLSSVKSGLNGRNAQYFTSKIPFGYNYIDENTTINHLSDTEGEHGSHVAGIAAANRYIKSGSSYVNAAESVKAVGMAPDAQLFVMKVFGSGGGAYDSDYMAAIEDALVLECDSVNLSLGGGLGFSYSSSYQSVLNNLTNNNYGTKTVVTISAGNSYSFTNQLANDLYIDDVSMHTGGSPGSFINSLCTSSADNITLTGKPLIFNEDQNVFFTENIGSKATAIENVAGTYSYVYIDGYGETAEYSAVNNAVSLSGKVVIVNRGELSFYEKGNNAISYNPKAMAVANNQDGLITMNLDDYTGTFPMVFISLADAETIKANSAVHTAGGYTYYTGTVVISSDLVSVQQKSREDTVMSDFSSWGVPGSLLMKPEITAPGGNIYSVFGTNKTGSNTYTGGSDQYELMSGTSMAAPHMAGLSAVLAQYVRENSIAVSGYSTRAVNQSLLMSTAVPMKNDGQYVSILQQGSGLVDVYQAISAKSSIMMDANDGTLTAKTKAAQDGKVKAEIGDNPTREADYTYGFTLYNRSNHEITYDLSTDLFTQATDGKYMLQTTSPIEGWNVTYDWEGNESTEQPDVNGDELVNEADAQTVLDYVTALKAEVTYEGSFDPEAADVNKDGKITTEDAYLILNYEEGSVSALLTIPAGESRKVTVTIAPSHTMDEAYPRGYYVEGFTYISSESTTAEGEIIDPVTYSIPILGFYGSWTDPSMFDHAPYAEKEYRPDESAYVSSGTTNYLQFRTGSSYSGATSYFVANPYKTEDTFPEERLAVNSSKNMYQIGYTLLRSAGTTGYAISRTDCINGNITSVLNSAVISTNLTGPYYSYSSSAWQSVSNRTYRINKTVTSYGLTEGDTFRVGVYAVPEYNAIRVNSDATAASAGYLSDTAFKNVLLSNVLGRGAFMGYDFTVDNTAPVVEQASLSGNTLTVRISDNQNLAYVAIKASSGSTIYAEAVPAAGEYTLTCELPSSVSTFIIFAGDYAQNETSKSTRRSDLSSVTEPQEEAEKIENDEEFIEEAEVISEVNEEVQESEEETVTETAGSLNSIRNYESKAKE
ncbi:MAG: S8 family serine peptidase, partial [Erysipelotrichaceae bacterium]|nr:S8 family serine peptidase [Erysipelotrichaceae bacterium]